MVFNGEGFGAVEGDWLGCAKCTAQMLALATMDKTHGPVNQTSVAQVSGVTDCSDEFLG